MKDKKAELLAKCKGVEFTIETKQLGMGGSYDNITYHLIDDIIVPDNVYIKILKTPTKGTIGKLIGIECYKNSFNDEITPSSMTYIIQVDGRRGTNRISQWNAVILENHDGSTKFIRNIKKRKLEVIPPHINKYKQSLNRGEWVAGIGPKNILYFGKVTRWSASSVWVNPTPSIPKSKENCISRPMETIVLPTGIDYQQMITMMVLSGWKR